MSETQKPVTKKPKKGKTIALNDFLADTSKTVTVRATNWSDIVDHEEAETKPIRNSSRKVCFNHMTVDAF